MHEEKYKYPSLADTLSLHIQFLKARLKRRKSKGWGLFIISTTMKHTITTIVAFNALLTYAACPYMDSEVQIEKRQENSEQGGDSFLDQFVINDEDDYTTTDFGTPVNDRNSLKAGERGPTLLEDFVFRTKMTRFDHERIPERAGIHTNY